MKTKEELSEDEKIENELQLDMISSQMSKICRGLEWQPKDKEELNKGFRQIRELKLLLNKFENCLKLLDLK